MWPVALAYMLFACMWACACIPVNVTSCERPHFLPPARGMSLPNMHQTSIVLKRAPEPGTYIRLLINLRIYNSYIQQLLASWVYRLLSVVKSKSPICHALHSVQGQSKQRKWHGPGHAAIVKQQDGDLQVLKPYNECRQPTPRRCSEAY